MLCLIPSFLTVRANIIRTLQEKDLKEWMRSTQAQAPSILTDPEESADENSDEAPEDFAMENGDAEDSDA